MKVLVQDRVSEKFIFSPTSWTEKEEEALDFESAARAKAFCVEHTLRDAQIIVRRGGTPDIRMPSGVDPEPVVSADKQTKGVIHR